MNMAVHRIPAVSVFGTGMWSMLVLMLPVLLVILNPAPVQASFNTVGCKECDEARCPVLHYCEGQAVKDQCGCCTVCTSAKYQPHKNPPRIAPQPGGQACRQVECPKLKICVENMQGLPLCTCPSIFVCRRTKKREICGSDGKTYESRCHMKIASCNQGVAVRKRHKGPCTEEDEEKGGAAYRKKMKKMKRRRRRRRRRKEQGDDKDGDKRVRRRRKDNQRRKRRKSGSRKSRGKTRARRHRRRSHGAGRTFDDIFAHYTWEA